MNTLDWMPRINQQRCNGCGICIEHCPAGVLLLSEGKAVLAYPDQCRYCAACELVCPVQAIELPFLVCRRNTQQGGNYE